MNLLLFESAEEATRLAPDDPRTRHVREVLRTPIGGQIYVGVVNGSRGAATLQSDDASGIALSVRWEGEPPPLYPVHLLVGLPRPQTARKLLQECASLGLARVDFFQSEKGERSYAQSTLWRTDEWRRHLLQGAEQAFGTRIPEVAHFAKLSEALGDDSAAPTPLALDNYEATSSLARACLTDTPTQLILGSERGFSSRERDQLRERNIPLCHLGERVLRTETAALAGVSLLLSRLGCWD